MYEIRKETSMNIEHKKTALDDDSLLYQKRDDSLGKKDTTELTKKQKLNYFTDYYLKTILVVVAVLALVGSFLYTVIFHRQTTIFSIAFVDEAFLRDTEGLQASLRDYYQLTDDDDFIMLEDYDLNNYNEQMKFATMLGAQSIDVVVCTEERFEDYAKSGYFLDLSMTLPADLREKFESAFVEAAIEETDQEGNVTRTLPAAPYGIDITENAVYRQYGGEGEKVILGVINSSERLENTLNFLRYLDDPSGEPVQEESPQT